MVEPVVVAVVVVGARLVYALAALWSWPVRERARAHALATLVRAAGPGAVVEVTRADGGGTVTARTAGPGTESR
ncbi:hypothetical protein [Streptomyces sp. SID8352]|uniref:hypothetical protein n=1 Tax=Streptomyces sp. SID8352 TaxID=2690338 RepID=UPI001927CF62|nr:hypothetical protein [Streptomyces sp. SID8352]